MAVEVVGDEADRKRTSQRERNKNLRREGELPPDLVDPDPAKHYHKVADDPKRIARFQSRGYRITPPDSKTKLPGAIRDERGMQKEGDLVLMETSSENYRKRVATINDRAHRFSVAAREEHNERMNQVARDAGLIGPHQQVSFDMTDPEKE